MGEAMVSAGGGGGSTSPYEAQFLFNNWEIIKDSTRENQWKWERFSSITTDVNALATLATRTPAATNYYNDSSTSITMNITDSYTARCTIYIYCPEAVTLTLTCTTDDAGYIYLNSEPVTNLTSCADKSVTFNFKEGLNKLVFIYTEGSGGDGWRTNPHLITKVGAEFSWISAEVKWVYTIPKEINNTDLKFLINNINNDEFFYSYHRVFVNGNKNLQIEFIPQYDSDYFEPSQDLELIVQELLNINERKDYLWNQPILTENGTIGGNTFAVTGLNQADATRAHWHAFDGVGFTTFSSISEAYNFRSWISIYNPIPIKIKDIKTSVCHHSGDYGTVLACMICGSNDNRVWNQIAMWDSGWSTSTSETNCDWGYSSMDLSNNFDYYKYYKFIIYRGSDDAETSGAETGFTDLEIIAYYKQ